MKKLFLFCFLVAATLPAFSAPPDDDLSAYKTADALWTHIDDSKVKLTDALHNDDAKAATLVPPMRAMLAAFSAKYPEDKRSWDAKLLLAQLDVIASKMKLPDIPSIEETMKRLAEISADKSAPKDARAQAGLMVITQAFPTHSGEKADLDGLDAKIAAFEKDFPDFSLDGQQPAFFVLRQEEMTIFKMTAGEAAYAALLKKLVVDPSPPLAEYAKEEQDEIKKIAELEQKPFELKYTAVDGTKVDLAQMRGKAVLIDFWATWCPPCVAEMPDVVKAYQKYHGQGLEIVGVSLDQDKDEMLAFTKKNGMPWPQYFDGEGLESNAISRSFGIDSIPTMWLIDKKGMLVNSEAGQDLDANIEKLLKGP